MAACWVGLFVPITDRMAVTIASGDEPSIPSGHHGSAVMSDMNLGGVSRSFKNSNDNSYYNNMCLQETVIIMYTGTY